MRNPNFITFTTLVPTAGVPVRLVKHSVAFGCEVVIKAKNSNTGRVKIGRSDADAVGGQAFTLGLNEAASLKIANTEQIWVDATVNGDGVEVIFETYETNG